MNLDRVGILFGLSKMTHCAIETNPGFGDLLPFSKGKLTGVIGEKNAMTMCFPPCLKDTFG
jgi:hypothetical protein